MDPAGAVALVTGGGSGIGRAIALRLAQDGAAVAVADLDEASAHETAGLIEGAARGALAIGADVADEAQVREMIARTGDRFGRLDILVNNAGVVEGVTTQRMVFPELDPSRWMRMLDVNVRGVVLGTQLGIAAMRERGGVIVNVSSMAGTGLGPHPAPVYAASKAAVIRFSAALAPLARRLRIRVNCVCPDWVETPMVQRARNEMSAQEWQAIAPASMTQPDEIADAVARIVGDESLAGRVMLCVGPKPWPLAEPGRRPS